MRILKASDIQPPDDPARVLADRRKKRVREALVAMLAGLAGLFGGAAVLRMIGRLDSQALGSVLRSQDAEDLFIAGYQPIADTFLEAARQAANDNFAGLVPYDALAAAGPLQTLRDQFTKAVLDAAANAIQGVLLDGLRAGADPEIVAARLREIINLAPQQARAVVNFRRMLETGDKTVLQRALRDQKFDQLVQRAIRGEVVLKPEQIDRMVSAYAIRSLNHRADQMAATEAMQASVSGIRDAHVQAVKSGRLFDSEVRRFWLTAADERVCPICSSVPLLNLGGVGVNEEYQSISGSFLAPLAHPMCLPGDARVQASDISAATKRWYDGDLVIIETASGKRLYCTPNHPVLTPGGWAGATTLNVGGHVIGDAIGKGMATVNHDHQNIPSRIEQVASAFGRSRKVTSREVPTAAEDFHGDGIGSEVAIVWANRQLLHADNGSLGQHLDEALFDLGHVVTSALVRLRAQYLLLKGVFAQAGRSMSGLCQAHALGSVGLAHADDHAFGPVRRRDAMSFQNARYHRAGDAQSARGLFDGHIRAHQADRFSLIDGRSRGLVWPAGAASPHSPIQGEAIERGDRDAVMAAQILQGRFGPVAHDEIVKVERRPFAGHVFNLETVTGWYVAEGIITHNCRCSERYHADLSRLTEQPFRLAA